MRKNTHYNNDNGMGISGKHRARIMRDNEFMAAYRKVLDLMLERGVPDARRAAIDFTVMNTQPHYHVSYDRAYIVVTKILNDHQNPVQPSLQAQMWEEIAGKVQNLLACNKLSISRALQFVLEHCRASRFFITPQYAYYHIRKSNPLIKQHIL